MQQVKHRKKLKVYNLIILVSLIVMVFSLVMIGIELYNYKKSQNNFEKLAETVVVEQDISVEESPYLVLDGAFTYNPDMYGWISIDDTVLNYPVMYTPDNVEYYLRRDFDKRKSNAGTPFLGYDTNFEGNHLVVYAHNMKNGTMFAPLLKYKDLAFLESHPIIKLQTKDKYYEYQVFSAFYSRRYYSDETDVFRYYNYPDLSDESIYKEYVDQVKSSSLIINDITPSYPDDLLTLSTCEYSKENGRFVVVAQCIKEENINNGGQ